MISHQPAGQQTFSPAIAHASRYQRWIFDALKPAIGQRLVEVGVGSAPFVQWYRELEAWAAVDLDNECVTTACNKWHEAYPSKKVVGVTGDIGAEETWNQLRDFKPNSLIAVNVLEHVEDDTTFIKRAGGLLAPQGGRLGLFVPAGPWLYGTMDKAAGHFRRYTPQALNKLLNQNGFHIESLRYMNLPGALLWLWLGRVKRINDLADESLNAQIDLYDRVAIPIVRAFEKIIKPPYGQSLAVIAKTL